MGKPTGFLDYEREDARAESPKERIKHFNEFHIPLSREEQQKQGARCMDCGNHGNDNLNKQGLCQTS